MKATDWSKFTLSRENGKPISTASISLFLYFGSDARGSGEAIQSYVASLPSASLNWYVSASGAWKTWTTRVMHRDLKLLHDFPRELDSEEIYYDSDPVPGPFGLELFAAELQAGSQGTTTNSLRFDFPVDLIGSEEEAQRLAALMTTAKRILEVCRPQSANMGLTFKRCAGSYDAATKGVNAQLMRFVGFDPCYRDARDRLRGQIFTAHWINYIDGQLCNALGGIEQIRAKLPGCEVEPLADGLWIRSAERPGIGDVNRGAMDLGWMPEVARVLKPIRAEFHAFGRPDFDASRWMRRLDELPVGPWNNGVDDAAV
jgi:hypothetical protein